MRGLKLMKLQGEYSFKDFSDLFFNKYYFNSKQNLASRVLIVVTLAVLVFEAVLFVFFHDFYKVFTSYIDAKFVAFLMLLLLASYFFKPKIFYESYKKQHKPENYIELDEKEFRFHSQKQIKIEMKRLRNTVVLKNGYFLDFDETFLVYIPHRFFRNTEELKFFHSLCYRRKV